MGDNLSDVMSVDSNDMPLLDSSEEDDRPLLKLFKRLIGNDTKQNTVLTNAQIVDILKREFLMDISYIHELEIEIYLNLMKKFLKDWPQWDEFDQTIQTIKMQKDKDNDNEKSNEQLELEANYENLKMYLNEMLGTAKPLIKNAVDDVKKSLSTPRAGGAVALEVICTREQLHGLFYRRPHPDYNNTIFNIEPIPQKIALYTQSLKSIFNWPKVQILVNFGSVTFKRKTCPVFTQRLVNRKLSWKDRPEEMNVQLHTKDIISYSTYTVKDVLDALEQPLPYSNSQEIVQIITVLTELIKSDLTCSLNVSIPSIFRRTLNKYPYVRYFYADVKSAKDSRQRINSYAYDLQMEETIVPKLSLQILKFHKGPLKYSEHWLNVKCLECNMEFSDCTFRAHFEECHRNEKDWQCMNCGKSFDMIQLSVHDWTHTCQ